MGNANGLDRQRQGRGDLRTARRGSPHGLVADGDEHCGQQVLPRETGVTGPRNRGVATGAAGGGQHRGMGAEGRLFQDAPGRGELPYGAGPPDADAKGLLQLSGLVQRGRAGGARVWLGL